MPEDPSGPVDRVEVRAPARADLAGGTLDLWPLYCLHRPALTVNVALHTRLRLRATRSGRSDGELRFLAPGVASRRLRPADAGRDLVAGVVFHFLPEGGLDLEILEQPPFGSGLGGSSVLAVALARACLSLGGRRLPAARLVAVLRDLEAGVLGVPTGVQDYWPALVGGVVAIHLLPGGETVERVEVPADWVASRLAVVFTGVTHRSGMVNWDVYRARVDGDPRVREGLDRIAAAATTCRAALVAGDEEGVGRAIAAEWRARRELAPSVSSPEVERVVAAGLDAGALAAKACGAGGGGSVLFWSPPTLRTAVAAAAAAAVPGAEPLPGGIDVGGARVARLA